MTPIAIITAMIEIFSGLLSVFQLFSVFGSIFETLIELFGGLFGGDN